MPVTQDHGIYGGLGHIPTQRVFNKFLSCIGFLMHWFVDIIYVFGGRILVPLLIPHVDFVLECLSI